VVAAVRGLLAIASHGEICCSFFVAKQAVPGSSKSGSTRLRDLAGYALIFAVTLLAYLPAISGGFLWDDDRHVTRPDLRSLDGLRRIWFELGASQQYYPLLHSAFWVEHRLWGDAVVGYHLTNLLLHATAACLVVAVVRRLFAARENSMRYAGVGWVAGFIFALHPVCVESVAWISEQKNTLSAVFYLSAALAYLGFDRERRGSQYALALGWFVLALLSKTVTATLPAALLVVFWWQRGRLEWRRDISPLLPWFVLGLTGGLLTAWVEHRFFITAQTALGEGADYDLTWLERGLLAGRIIWFYLGKLLWPADLIFIYPQWRVDPAVGWQYLFPLGILALVTALAWLARRHRGPLAGFLIFCGTLLPALGFINVYPFIYSYVADHFQYLASLGIIVPLAAGLTLAARSLPAARGPALVAGGLLLAGLGGLASRQSGMYRNIETLYRETLARNPDCWMAQGNLGLILAGTPAGLPEALPHFEAAVRIKPGNAEMHNYLGSALARIPGRRAEALEEFATALQISPNFPYTHLNLGLALLGDPARRPEAVGHLETAVRLKPDWAEAHNLLGYALAQTPGRGAEAVGEYRAALQLNPDLADAHSNLAIALVEIPGGLAEAITHFAAVTRLNPDSADAHYNLGYALTRVPGHAPEALAEFEIVLKIAPNNEEARHWVERLKNHRA